MAPTHPPPSQPAPAHPLSALPPTHPPPAAPPHATLPIPAHTPSGLSTRLAVDSRQQQVPAGNFWETVMVSILCSRVIWLSENILCKCM